MMSDENISKNSKNAKSLEINSFFINFTLKIFLKAY